MKFRKVIAFILCAIMSLSLVACGQGGGSGAGGGGNQGDGTTHTITFDIGSDARVAGVNEVPSQTVVDGSTISALPNPTGYDGYVFMGWYEGNEQFLSTTQVKRDWTLVAKWVSEAEMDAIAQAYQAGLSDSTVWKADHLYIHYKRYDHKSAEESVVNTGEPKYSSAINSQVYSDWCAWVWPKNDNGRCFNAAKIDASGAVYDIDLKATGYNDAGWDGKAKKPLNVPVSYADAKTIGFQLFSYKSRTEGTGFWANDGGDNDLILANLTPIGGAYHWFVTQGNVTQGSEKFSNKEIVDPYKDKATGSQVTRKDGDQMINSSADNKSKFPTPNSKPAGYDEAGVGYQIFIASFCDSNDDGIGDIRGIINKLDYLESLNVDVLWLTPFQSSTNYHGYDIKDYFSVDPRFGTLADYRELVYKVHEKGMKIVMDFVLNHTSKSNPWFVKSQNLVIEDKATGAKLESDPKDGSAIDYRQFYTWISKAQYDKLPAAQKGENGQWFGPLNGNGKAEDGYYFFSSFSSDMPELNYDYQPVRDAVLDVCNYWMEFGLDGFRLDAVKHIYMKNEVTGVGKTASTGSVDDGKGCVEDGNYSYDLARNLNFYREFNCRLKKNYPGAFLVGENLEGNPRNTTNYYQGIDSQFNFNMYYDASRAIYRSYDDAGCGSTALTAYMKGEYGNQYNSGGQVNVKGYRTVNPNYIDGMFTSNHDLPRARERMNCTFKLVGTEETDVYHEVKAADANKTLQLLRMYYGFIFTMPGLNWIYYGDEIGMTGLMPMSDGKSSTASSDASPHEDRVYRQPMKWFTDINKNASYSIGYNDFKCELEGLNKTSSVASVEAQQKDNKSLLKWVQKLTEIRDANPALINGKVTQTISVNPDGSSKTIADYQSGSSIFYTITNNSASKGAKKIKVYMNFGSTSLTISSGTVLASVDASGNIGTSKNLTKDSMAIVAE